MSKVSRTTLGNLIEFQRGFDLPKSQFIKGKYPVHSSNGVLGYHSEYRVIGPGITIGRSGTVGLPHLIKSNFYPHNTTLFIKDFKNNDVKYIFYLLKNLKLGNKKSGSSVPTMNRNHLYPLQIIAHLELKDQKSIAKVLSDLDAKIKINNKINQELEAMAKTLYDYWFVQFDFPDKNGKPYKSSGGKMIYNEELKREIPAGWEVKVLSSIVKHNYRSISKKDRFNKIDYLDTSNLTKNVIDKTQEIRYDIDKVPSRAQRVINPKDRLYSTVRPNLCHYGIIKHPKDNLIASSGFVQLSSEIDLISNDLLYTYLTSSWVTQRLHQIATLSVSSYPSISPNDILELKIVLPKINKNFKFINSEFDEIYSKISINQLENQKLAELRDWLLPMLMNGQVTVK